MVSPNIYTGQSAGMTTDRGVGGAPDAIEPRTPVTPAISDRVRWAPIIAGLVCCVSLLLLLGALGAALGLTVQYIADGDVSPTLARWSAGIWGVLVALVSFFVGGYVAASTASFRGRRFGLFHGAMVWAASIAVILLGLGTGLSTILGGANYQMFALPGMDGGAFDLGDATAAAWTTFVSLTLGLVAAALGGMLGSRKGMLEVDRDRHSHDQDRDRDRDIHVHHEHGTVQSYNTPGYNNPPRGV